MAIKEALEIVAERGKVYGGQIDGFAMTAKMWSAYFGIPITPENVAMAMLLNKVARQRMTHKHDNLVDIAGYAECVDEMNAEAERRASFKRHCIQSTTDGELVYWANNGESWQREMAKEAIVYRAISNGESV